MSFGGRRTRGEGWYRGQGRGRKRQPPPPIKKKKGYGDGRGGLKAWIQREKALGEKEDAALRHSSEGAFAGAQREKEERKSNLSILRVEGTDKKDYLDMGEEGTWTGAAGGNVLEGGGK